MYAFTDANYKAQKSHAEKLRIELKKEWIQLWSTKYDDKNKGEGVSTNKHHRLYVDKGQVIYATRDYSQLDFNEILEKNLGKEYAEKTSPPPEIGGYRKFAKKTFPSKKKPDREKPKIKIDLSQHQRKSGRGWLNQIRIAKKIQESENKNRY